MWLSVSSINMEFNVFNWTIPYIFYKHIFIYIALHHKKVFYLGMQLKVRNKRLKAYVKIHFDHLFIWRVISFTLPFQMQESGTKESYA